VMFEVAMMCPPTLWLCNLPALLPEVSLQVVFFAADIMPKTCTMSSALGEPKLGKCEASTSARSRFNALGCPSEPDCTCSSFAMLSRREHGLANALFSGVSPTSDPVGHQTTTATSHEIFPTAATAMDPTLRVRHLNP
jgi:hypothetical protein